MSASNSTLSNQLEEAGLQMFCTVMAFGLCALLAYVLHMALAPVSLITARCVALGVFFLPLVLQLDRPGKAARQFMRRQLQQAGLLSISSLSLIGFAFMNAVLGAIPDGKVISQSILNLQTIYAVVVGVVLLIDIRKRRS